MKKYHPQTALGALGARLMRAQGDLAEARKAAEKVLRFLPTPSVCDHMLLPKGIPLPSTPLFKPSPNPPMVEVPGALFDGFNLLDPIRLPDSWLPAYLEYQPRLHRAWWLRQLHPECSRAPRQGTPSELSRLDGVVAGLLFLLLQPLIGSRLREQLFRRAAGTHKFGTLLAAQGMLLAEEQKAILMLLGSDSGFLCWLSQIPGWDEECLPYCVRHHNLHAAIMMLRSPLGESWLERLINQAHDHPDAAAAALVLQPNAPEKVRMVWIETVERATSGRLPCLVARFARQTWPEQGWRHLQERLKEKATNDKGRDWCHWHSVISDSEEARAALGDPQADVLWALELLRATQAPDAALRGLLGERLAANPSDEESIVALDWLDSRQ
jgi:hypothetical protein